jgi:hypothetical protein
MTKARPAPDKAGSRLDAKVAGEQAPEDVVTWTGAWPTGTWARVEERWALGNSHQP